MKWRVAGTRMGMVVIQPTMDSTADSPATRKYKGDYTLKL